MIEAEIKGKLGRDGANAHDRCEDLLTSTAFGLIKYLPFCEGMRRVLSHAKPVSIASDERLVVGPAIGYGKDWLSLTDVVGYEQSFWPSLGRYGEPDLIIQLHGVGRQIEQSILVEVKLLSPKSSEAAEDEDYQEHAPDGDQLVRYWQGLTSGACPSGSKPTIIYLTSHILPPEDELRASLLRNRHMHLAWLSWRDVWDAVNESALLTGHPAALDLARLLAYKDFERFQGLRASPRSFIERHFWKTEWFSRGWSTVGIRRHFWRAK